METHPVPPAVDSDVRSGRGTFSGEALFLIRLLRLSFILGLEYIYYLSYGAFFLLLRRSYRERMRRLVLGAGGATTAALLLVLLIGGPGCAPQVQEPVNPRSFKAQMRELRWSMDVLADQSDSKKSLEEDLQAFATDKTWKEDLQFSVQSIIRMDDAKKSLEEDLKAFGDPDHKEHGLQETFELWGF